MVNSRTIFSALLLLVFAVGCTPAAAPTTENGPQAAESATDETPDVAPLPSATSTALSTPTLAPTAEPSATPTAQPSVRVVALTGNLYIRRGPSTAYDRIGLLSKGSSADVIGQDVLSKWVQVRIPGSEATGWVSIMTPFSSIEGELAQIPAFTFNEWPKPAYIKNCTEHDLLVKPNELYLYNLFTNAQYLNEVQVDPGVYDIHDLFVPGEPLIEKVDVREGQTAYITVNGLGVKHNCP